MCGNCCRDIVLYHGGRWITNEKQLKELCRDDPGAERMVCTGRDDEGVLTFTCSALTEEGFCSVHEDRMSLCRNYPTKGLYYRGGWLDARCGYSFKVTRFRDVIMHRKRVRMPRFDKILEQEKNKL